MDLPGVILSLKTSLILSKGAPVRTTPRVCVFRLYNFSHHYQVPDLTGRKKLFFLKKTENQKELNYIFQSCASREELVLP